MEAFATGIDRFAAFLKEERRKQRSIIAGGDFNSKSPVWGSSRQDHRGTILLEELLKVELHPMKPRRGHTFARVQSVGNPDVVAATPELQNDVTPIILEKETASDHKYVVTEFVALDRPQSEAQGARRWKASTFDAIKMKDFLDSTLPSLGLNEGDRFSAGEERKFLEMIPRMCDAAMETIESVGSSRRKNPWWTPELKEPRRKAQYLRRRLQRARKHGEEEEFEAVRHLYKRAKRRLNTMIAKAKEKAWIDLCEAVNEDVLGRPYKAVMKQARSSAPPASLSPEFAEQVMKGLFPQPGEEE